MNRVLASLAVAVLAIVSTAAVAKVVTSSDVAFAAPVKKVLCQVYLLNQSS